MLEGTDALAPVYRQLIALSDHKMRGSALRTHEHVKAAISDQTVR